MVVKKKTKGGSNSMSDDTKKYPETINVWKENKEYFEQNRFDLRYKQKINLTQNEFLKFLLDEYTKKKPKK